MITPYVVPDCADNRGMWMLFFNNNQPVVSPPAIHCLAIARKPIFTVIDECVEAKRLGNRRDVYIYRLRNYLTRFAEPIRHLDISDVGLEHIEAWFRGRKESPYSRKTAVQRISALFSFAIRRGYRSDNPCKRLEPICIEHKPPIVFTPTEASTVLNFVRKWMPARLAYVSLGMFTGIRPTELQRLHWRDVCVERKIVKLDAAVSKVRRRRIVPISDNCIEWLKVCERDEKTIGHNEYSRMTELHRQTGIKWHKDILRHSCASYLLAKHEDVGRVARWLGNSPTILLNHYAELVTAEDCLAFWSIVP